MHKIEHQSSGEWVEYNHKTEYQLFNSVNSQRIICGVPHKNIQVFESLATELKPPYYVLYILHTPRGEGSAGRYQSPEISQQELRLFLKDFSPLLTQDARFDIWVHSPADQGTIAWDRHNQIFCYGPLQRIEKTLTRLGYSAGSTHVPAPHAHCYHPELDLYAERLLAYFPWNFSPLRPEDEQ